MEVINRKRLKRRSPRPGNVAMVLSETGGLRVQVTSPALGAANIRVQGMDGRYTQLLADGLPLYGGQASSLGQLQTPTDLGQVEVIKGAASALWTNGPRRRDQPRFAPPERRTRNGDLAERHEPMAGDVTAYTAALLASGLRASMTGGYRQSRQDLDDDGWIDIAGYKRWTARPRIFQIGRRRGDVSHGRPDVRTARWRHLPGRVMADGNPFLKRRRPTGRHRPCRTGTQWCRRHGPCSGIGHDAGAPPSFRRCSKKIGMAPLPKPLAGKTAGTSWIGGLAYQRDRFRSRSFELDGAYEAREFSRSSRKSRNSSPSPEAPARLAAGLKPGTQFSPRLSLLYRPGN